MRSVNAAVSATGEAATDPRQTWMEVRDAILRELVHALSNRTGTLVAASGMLDAGSVDVAGRVLSGEAERLETLVVHFRLATGDPFGVESAPEPLILADVVADAVALYGIVARVNAAVLVHEGDVPPVVASRVGLTHAVLLLLHGGATVLRATATSAGVALRGEPTGSSTDLDAATWLLARSDVHADESGALILHPLGSAGTQHALPLPS